MGEDERRARSNATETVADEARRFAALEDELQRVRGEALAETEKRSVAFAEELGLLRDEVHAVGSSFGAECGNRFSEVQRLVGHLESRLVDAGFEAEQREALLARTSAEAEARVRVARGECRHLQSTIGELLAARAADRAAIDQGRSALEEARQVAGEARRAAVRLEALEDENRALLQRVAELEGKQKFDGGNRMEEVSEAQRAETALGASLVKLRVRLWTTAVASLRRLLVQSSDGARRAAFSAWSGAVEWCRRQRRYELTLSAWARSESRAFVTFCWVAWRDAAEEGRRQRVVKAEEHDRLVGIAVGALARLATGIHIAFVRMCFRSWQDIVEERCREKASADRERLLQAPQAARCAAVDWALSLRRRELRRRCFAVWATATQAVGLDGPIARRTMQRLAEARGAVAAWRGRARERQRSGFLFSAWLLSATLVREQRLEDERRHNLALIETRRQAAAARALAEESARRDLDQQVTSIQAEVLVEGSERKVRELETLVASLKASLGDAELRMAKSERQAGQMRAELGKLTAELAEEQWQHAGARARLEGVGLRADAASRRALSTTQSWKSERARAEAVLSRPEVADAEPRALFRSATSA